jgi:hypothetical protein
LLVLESEEQNFCSLVSQSTLAILSSLVRTAEDKDTSLPKLTWPVVVLSAASGGFYAQPET